MDNNVCPCMRHKHREEQEYKDLIKRLNRVEGQIRGIKKMVEEERYCIDILNQVSAAGAALNGFSEKLLENHIKSCVVEDIKKDDMASVEELCQTLHRLMK